MSNELFKGRTITLEQMLTARSNRAERQKKLLGQEKNQSLVCLTLNIPGPIKNSYEWQNVFLVLVKEIEQAFSEEEMGAKVLHHEWTGSEYYLKLNVAQKEAKQKMVVIEEEHPFGRLADIDVLAFTENIQPLTREKLGYPKRKCLLCTEEAKVCGRSRTHTVKEMQYAIQAIVDKERRRFYEKIQFMETVLRDGQQSLIATRMPTSDMLPILKTMDQAGYHSLEMWGGATFDSCLRFLNEDPWERLRTIRKEVKNTKLQMLLRGQNLLGYKNYADDVVRDFVEKSIQNGIDIIRVFDALNDTRNLQTAIVTAKEAGGHCQAAISYTTSPIHTVDYFVQLAKEMADTGADSICIKDMAGVLTPHTGFDLVSRIKETIDLPLEVHTHATSGIAEMTYLKVAEAGADIIDTAISSFAGGTSQPATESVAMTLAEMGFDTGLDMDKVAQIAEHFNPVRDRFREEGLLNPKVKDIEPKTLIYQVPGGMLSNLLSQLTEQGLQDKYEDVLAEVPKVRADLGYPPLVTPLSQMVGTQALMNVISGERYKLVPSEIKDYVRGLYGKAPVPISEEIKELIIGQEAVVTVRPADLIAPQLPEFRKEIAEYAKTEENVLMYALFPKQAKDFLGRREDPFYDVPLQTVEVKIDFSA